MGEEDYRSWFSSRPLRERKEPEMLQDSVNAVGFRTSAGSETWRIGHIKVRG